MKCFYLALACLISFHVGSAHALNRSKCSRLFGDTSGMGKKERHFAKMFSATTSSGQFTTSTGSCSLIGGISREEKKLFIADNSEQLKKDIVRAEGDYLLAVAVLYSCQEKNHEQLALRLQQNTTKIFGESLEHNSTKISDELDALMSSDAKLRSLCTVQGA